MTAVTRPTIIYVSGPITTGGNVPVNVRRGIEAAVMLMDRGYVVICPHEKALGMEMLAPRDYEAWMKYDFLCIQACDAVYRMGDAFGNPVPSAGGDREVEYARSIGKPVYYSYDTLFAGMSTTVNVIERPWGRIEQYRVDVGSGSSPGFAPQTFSDDAPDATVEDIEA